MGHLTECPVLPLPRLAVGSAVESVPAFPEPPNQRGILMHDIQACVGPSYEAGMGVNTLRLVGKLREVSSNTLVLKIKNGVRGA